MNKERIWELDFFRGAAILGVVAVHFIFDLQYFAGANIQLPPLYEFIKQNGGVLFIILSGMCATLGTRSAKRGAFVLSCGLVITAVTVVMFRLGMADRSILIQFGVLHLIGCSMLLYPVYKRWPLPLTAICGAIITAAGYYMNTICVESPALFVFGLVNRNFVSGDYFPLLPFMGWFMLGTVVGKTVYRNKTTLFPQADTQNVLIRFFSFLGRNSLWVYMLHQPVCYALVSLLSMS